ncbi:MAG: phage tail protein [Eubacterium sp.]|jgi:phage tail-like protein|nr:phage tail protein [Eubacterium sp.]
MALTLELLTGFRFIVSIGPLQMGFQQLSGISRQIELETYQEGGLNGFVHIFSKPISGAATLTMEKGVYPVAYNPFYMVGERLPYPLIVMLLTTDGIPGKTYTFNDCIIKKWQTGNFHATENKLIIDTFEVGYTDFFVV